MLQLLLTDSSVSMVNLFCQADEERRCINVNYKLPGECSLCYAAIRKGRATFNILLRDSKYILVLLKIKVQESGDYVRLTCL